MITTSRSRKNPPEPKRLSLQSWRKGYISAQSSNRTPRDGLRGALNVLLTQDGAVRPWPSLVAYGEQPTGTVLGEIAEFTKRTGSTSENYEISVQNVSGTAKVYVRKDGDNWVVCNGKTFDTTARCHFCPIRDIDSDYNDEDKVLVLNGVDNLAYLDINTLTVIPFVALAPAAAPSLTVGGGLTGSTFTNRYRVTASNRGETAASAAVTATTSKIRDSWSGSTEYIDVQITRVTNAERYHIYYGLNTGEEAYLFSIDDPGSGSTVTWRDTGTISPDPYRVAPQGDTTAGPIGERASFINGQVFIVGDPNYPKYVRFGGTGASILDFSPYGGGGFQPVGGNKEVPVKAGAFRDNSGNPAITVLCRGTNGLGKRYILSPQSTTIGNTIISYFAVREENGADGTDAPDTVSLIRDQLVYLSRDGVKTTFTKAQVQTILSTEGLSDLIQPDIARLSSTSIDKAVAITHENKWYVALPVGSTSNNQIWTLDFSDLRRGAWMLPREISADWMWLYNDNSGTTHFCILSNNQILEFTYSLATQDDGVGFSTGISTGILKFSDDGQEWAKVLRVIYVLQRPVGQISVSVSGKTEDSPLASLGSETFMSQTDVVGWDERPWDYTALWDEVIGVPDAYGVDLTEIEIEIDEELKWLSCDLSSSVAGVDYELTDIIVEFIPTGTKR